MIGDCIVYHKDPKVADLKIQVDDLATRVVDIGTKVDAAQMDINAVFDSVAAIKPITKEGVTDD